MPANANSRPIVIKRRKAAAGPPHHGGAWKIAYADFVTAMMAFFLLMWLLNATTEEQRKGLADYFNPSIPISRTSAGGAGMLEGEMLLDETKAAGSVPEGVQPRPTRRDDGPPLGKEDAAAKAEAAPEATAGGAADLDPAAAARQAAERAEQARLEAVERQIEAAMRERGELARHFFLHLTPEGLVIEIIDADDRPLFASASAEPAPVLPALIEVLVPVLEETTNDIAVVGHTDSVPYGSEGYSNWELSADRANAARRLLVRSGLPEARIARVTGKAAVEPLVADPTAPQNRRISITLLRDQPPETGGTPPPR
jgi:chemotaxis protein MotB